MKKNKQSLSAKADNMIEKSIDLGGRKLTLQTGKIAGQADGAVLATYGETVVLATVVSATPKMVVDFLPLTVDYQEKLYAGGRIKGSRWVKRDGKPSDEEILTSRVIDRSIRPLFPKEYRNEVQVIVTVLSVDKENDPKIVGATAVSAALAMSTVPWMGPVAPICVGLKDGQYILNPTDSQMQESSLDLVVSATDKAVVMVEAGAAEVSEEEVQKGIAFAQDEGQVLIKLINEFAKEVGKTKQVVVEHKYDKTIEEKVKKAIGNKFDEIIPEMATKEMAGGMFFELKNAIIDSFEKDSEKIEAAEVYEKLFKKAVREILLSGKRPDGRSHTEIRPIWIEVGVLPRTHGSAIFTRGQTQVLSIATLGTSQVSQLLETAEGEEEKNYMHYYTMAPFTTGETGKVGSPNRREIGHGALAERALQPVVPSMKDFPYTIQVNSEVMSSNGSTSMASTCGSTLALMDAGVPIKSPVSGIAMGLIVEDDKKYAVLTDIIGLEDFNGDMDFKVTGTDKGITALQLDVKTLQLTPKILGEALEQSKAARKEIMDKIKAAIAEPRQSVSKYAPKIKTIKIDPAKIGEVVGSGGKTIKKIVAETGADVKVEDDGSVNISAIDSEAMQKAVDWIEGLVKEVQPGEIYEGEVVRIQPFGAFVQILPGKDGMVHVSDMSENPEEFVDNAESKVKVGDKVKVRVKEVDQMGRINLSMRMDPSTDKQKSDRNGGDRGGRGGFRGGDRRGGFGRRDDRGPRRSFGGQRRDFHRNDRGFSRGRNDGEQGGPHFPASRFVEENK
ncbi:MAG TPA: polyribonucleotide nucleotidyltransferase [Patescibacteria group bacterium]|nr:polyribonucleotide nucleotidyltransferase [Patescibacteria group bacterium]